MARFDRAFKQPFEIVAIRYSSERGDCSIIFNKNTEKYFVGIGLTIENIKYGGEYGCKEFATEEDAYNMLYNLVD